MEDYCEKWNSPVSSSGDSLNAVPKHTRDAISSAVKDSREAGVTLDFLREINNQQRDGRGAGSDR